MSKNINIVVLLIISVLLVASCEEEKPVKKKRQFSIKQKTDTIKEKTNNTVDAENEKNIYKVTPSQFNDLGMELGKAEITSISQSINAAGYIEVPMESKAEVRSYIGGYLGSTPLLPGDYVKKGQFLISLENMEYIQLQQDYLQARDELTYLKTVFERKKTLADEQITSLSSKQEAESYYNSALANYEGLRKMLQLINIDPDKLRPANISSSINLYAPINGYLTSVKAIRGLFADQTDVIFEIINTDHLHLELKVYEKDILKVKKGQKLFFRIPEADSKTYTGEVFLVGKTIEGEDKTVSVHCHISDEYDLPVIAGMYIEAEIYYDEKEAYCLPVDAFVHEDGAYFVFIVKSLSDTEYVFEKVKVDVSMMNDDCAAIEQDSWQFLEGTLVLVEGAFDL